MGGGSQREEQAARAPSRTGERVWGQPGRGYVGVGALSPWPLSASPPSQAQGRSAPALKPLGSGPPQGPGHLLPRRSYPWFTRHPDTGQLHRGQGRWAHLAGISHSAEGDAVQVWDR